MFKMAINLTKLQRPLAILTFTIRAPLFRCLSSFQTLEETVKAAVESKNYRKIPDLLVSLKEPYQIPNPFTFLSNLTNDHRTRMIDEILQSFISIRPRCRPKIVYSCLLSYTLQSADPLPLAFAILQRTLRSGVLPVPQTRLLLSDAWLRTLRQYRSVADILLDMKSIGYEPDSGTCNYVISSLCAVDKLDEAVGLLKGMASAGCVPDLESYGAVISYMCLIRRTNDALGMIKQMVGYVGLVPRQGTVAKVLSALRANREIWKAVEVIEFLEKERYHVEFEGYEIVVEGCLECREYVLAGKVVMLMTDKSLIPYIKVRQKVVEGLAEIGEWKLACAVRQRFAELRT